MDPAKLSVYSGGGNDSTMEETSGPWHNGVDGEQQRDLEAREPDVVDGVLTAAEINNHCRGPADKYKFSAYGYQRKTKEKVVSDFSTLSKGTSVGAKPKAALRQVLFSQGVSEKTAASEERSQLDLLKQELETYAVPVNLKWSWKEESLGTTLEKNWTQIVDSHLKMSKMQRHQQEALWEFVHTELSYINKLVIIKDLVIAALVNLHRSGFLSEVTPELLFSNLPSILSAHQLFWQEVIFPMLQDVRRTGMPFDPLMLKMGCLQFPQRFSCYQHYCWEEENSLEFARRQMESNPHFFIFIQWVETHPQTQRMRLGDMQAKPHQRITKYPLLLKSVLQSTQNPHVQQTLRSMLSSVNSFLESINDYLKLKDEELALSISAQRVDGYEVEGINEEIDKYVREVCQFDLTGSIKGVGPGVVRKLLLEESLKIRGRKDSKLEVVGLLFSDVLLMTKFQKKGERLKVVRPPLALDRTYCMVLKDGCSFVLVEVGELQSVMNVYIFAASTSESCATWVSTIQQAKETLRSWREMESARKLNSIKAKADETSADAQLLQSGRETFVDELNEEFIVPQFLNGILASKETKDLPVDAPTHKTLASFFQPQPNNGEGESVTKGVAGVQPSVRGEWIEMGVRRQVLGARVDQAEKKTKPGTTNESGSVFRNNQSRSVDPVDTFHSLTAGPLGHSTAGPHLLLVGEYPAVDYPMNEESNSTTTSELSSIPGEGLSQRKDSEFQPGNQDTWRSNKQPDDVEIHTWNFSHNLKSPGLRKKRPNGSSQGPSNQTPTHHLDSSFSKSHSDYHHSNKRNSVPSELGLGSHSVSLQKGSWKTREKIPPDPQTLSEPELPTINSPDKWLQVKTQRSASIPNITTKLELRPNSSSLQTLPQCRQNSPLEGLLERAKERVKGRHAFKNDRNLKVADLRTHYPPPSPSFSTPLSASPSDGDRETEEEVEVEVELTRYRALAVSDGWKEQLVDGDEDYRRDSVIFTDGVNVDWPGWCFDDDEVLDNLYPLKEDLHQGIGGPAYSWDIQEYSQQEDGQCSQV
ncbi:uncharacterized protein isoform X1 [Takifugu rubripes]|uniref:uncharacterized protein isoform X1 n=1 Tax=Takifugu rubripes TaxID=31033 RepID=UPI0011454732|nr:uncharacterized protein LOC115246454 isoform X1 [Takifugu rubripes]